MKYKFEKAKVTELREGLGLSYKKFAVKFGGSGQMVHDWEMGYTEPHTKSLLAMCNAFEKHPSFFLVKNSHTCE